MNTIPKEKPKYYGQQVLSHRCNKVDVSKIYEKITNEEVLTCFQSKKLKKQLKSIMGGKKSERHNLMIAGIKNIDPNTNVLVHMANVTFLKDEKNIYSKLREICKPIYDEMYTNDPESDFKDNYIRYVLIPEGIIYYLMNKHGLGYTIANKFYIDYSNMESDNDESDTGPENKGTLVKDRPQAITKTYTKDNDDYIPDLERGSDDDDANQEAKEVDECVTNFVQICDPEEGQLANFQKGIKLNIHGICFLKNRCNKC